MALETASYIANLVVSNPDGGDQRSTADDHIRLIKAVLVRTFPNLDSAVSLSAVQYSYLGDLSASVQLQLNQLRDGSATVNNSLYANSASFAVRASRAESASFATFAGRAESASFANAAATAILALTANSASYAAVAGTAATATNATNATNASFATNAGNASTANNATNASQLGGLAPSDTGIANTIAQRNSSGDLFARYFKQDSGAQTISVGHVIAMQDLDGYHRVVPIAAVGQYMEARNISGRTGTAKTLSSSAPSGGSNGDVWLQY